MELLIHRYFYEHQNKILALCKSKKIQKQDYVKQLIRNIMFEFAIKQHLIPLWLSGGSVSLFNLKTTPERRPYHKKIPK